MYVISEEGKMQANLNMYAFICTILKKYMQLISTNTQKITINNKSM